jgi:HK97 family phage portal protein
MPAPTRNVPSLGHRARSLVPTIKAWWNGQPGAGRLIPTSEGFIPSSWPLNYWQSDLRPLSITGPNAAVESCVGAYAQVIGMLPCNHWRERRDGGRDLVKSSAAFRVMRRPNKYQSRADFFLNLIRAELLKGNGYAAALRDDNYQIESLHLIPPTSARPVVDPETREIYYGVGDNVFMLEPGEERGPWVMAIPARDMLHIRLQTPRDPLVGETPLAAAALSIAAGNAINAHEAAFFSNMGRPSGVLETDQELTKEQTADLRERWHEQTQGGNSGGTPILTWGLKWKAAVMNSQDAQVIEAYKMTIADVARVFRVPLAVIGDLGGATYNNTETLINHWLATGLGYMLEHIELALDNLFGLPVGEYMEFDTEYLLRTDFVARIDGITKGISGGLYSPNEGRRKVGLPDAEDGDEPRLQAQVVPLTAASATPAPSAPAAPAANVAANDDDEDEASAADAARMVSALIKQLKTYDRGPA